MNEAIVTGVAVSATICLAILWVWFLRRQAQTAAVGARDEALLAVLSYEGIRVGPRHVLVLP